MTSEKAYKAVIRFKECGLMGQHDHRLVSSRLEKDGTGWDPGNMGSEFPAYTPGTVRLYSMRWCPYAQRSRMVLDHKNIKYEVVNIDLSSKPDWYLKDINILGKVPALQMDDKIVFESVLVSEYVDELYPHNKLTQTDTYKRARDAMFMEIWSKSVVAFYKVYFMKDQADLPDIGKTMQEALELVEQEMETRGTPYLGGNEPMMVDFNVWPHMERIYAVNEIFPELNLKKERLARVYSWITRMSTVQAVRNTAKPVAFYKTMFDQRSQGVVDYDLGLEISNE